LAGRRNYGRQDNTARDLRSAPTGGEMRLMWRWRLLIVASILGHVIPAPALASPRPIDWPVTAGHFYTQANGFPPGTSPMGFAIVDDGQAQFWTAFQRRGGTKRLGFPSSQRFVWAGFISQATQKSILQWRPDTRTVDFVNVFDELSRVGQDDWLRSAR